MRKMAAVQYKIVLIGDAGVGKSTFFQRLRLGDGFDPESMGVVTLGADSFDYNCTVDGTPVKVSLYDTAGNEKYRSTITSNYFRHAHGVILMYSVEDHASLVQITEWKSISSQYTEHDLTWALIGNKVDLAWDFPEDKVKEKCEELKLDFSFMVSAKTGSDVKKAFEEIIHRIHNTKTVCRKPVKQDFVKVVSTKPKKSAC